MRSPAARFGTSAAGSVVAAAGNGGLEHGAGQVERGSAGLARRTEEPADNHKRDASSGAI